jgi:hypothetical protein
LQEIAQILGYIGIGSACLPISFCAFFNKKFLKNIHWSLLVLSLSYFLINITTLILFLNKNLLQENLFNIHYLIELVLLSVYYLKKVNSAAFIKLTIASIIVFSILAIALIYSGLFNVSSSVSLFSNIVLIIYSIYIVIDEYYYSETEKLTNNGTFLIASAVLFYAGVQFYFSLFDSMIREDSMQIFYYLWPIFQIGTIIYYNAFTYGLWKLAKS